MRFSFCLEKGKEDSTSMTFHYINMTGEKIETSITFVRWSITQKDTPLEALFIGVV